MKIRHLAALPACLLVALAQAQAPAPRPDPADPGARVPAQPYRSPFTDYKPLGETGLGDWRAANDEVGRIGGWRAYAREAQVQTPGGAAAASGHAGHGGEAAASPMHGHGHHGRHGMHGGKP
jgi:hypothetical protein